MLLIALSSSRDLSVFTTPPMVAAFVRAYLSGLSKRSIAGILAAAISRLFVDNSARVAIHGNNSWLSVQLAFFASKRYWRYALQKAVAIGFGAVHPSGCASYSSHGIVSARIKS